jgi:hypothetical protein
MALKAEAEKIYTMGQPDDEKRKRVRFLIAGTGWL